GVLASMLILFAEAEPRQAFTRTLVYIAAISYALYVIHPAFMLGWFNDENILVKYLVKRPLGFALTLALAHLSTFTWEARWQKAGRHLVQQWKHARSPTSVASEGKL
ncbi:MAG: hypothetical protein JSS20_14430, partial [Proteobacteria bacterium]|nr:hypothetical protein [Pseudomonadota bacterium]